MKISFDTFDASCAVILRSEDDFKSLQKDSPHYVIAPIAYPALYIGTWYDNPNGPDGYEYHEIISGEGLTIIEINDEKDD